MTTTPETILARFAAAYAEHGAGDELKITMKFGHTTHLLEGYAQQCGTGWKVLDDYGRFRSGFVNTTALTRIDYSNARYRGTAPLWQREG